MRKIIKSIIPTRTNHPAIGRLFAVLFTDGTHDYVYEETFFHQIPNYNKAPDYEFVIGSELDTSTAYFNDSMK